MAELRRSLGPFALIALGAAGVLGTSWIYTNGTFFAKYGAGGEIFGLVLGVVLAAFIALAYAELASRFPRAGGEIVYGYLAFDRRVAFVAGWLLIGAYVSSLAFYVTAAGRLLSKIFPGLVALPIYSIAGTTVHAPILIIGIVLAIGVCWINIRGMRLGAAVQIVFFVIMLAIGAALVIVGFGHGKVANFWPAYSPHTNAIASTLRFVLPAMTFVTGFSLVAVLAEDARLRPRQLAAAVVATVLIAGAFYCVVLLASAWVIPWTQTATLKQGAIDSYRIAGYPWLGWGAYVIAMLGLLTSFLAMFVATSRLMLAMGRAGLLPRIFARVDEKRGTPVNALLFTLVLGVVLGCLGQRALTWFLDTGGVYVGLAWFIGVMSMYRTRRRFTRQADEYRVRLSWLPGIGAVAAVLIIAATLIPGTDMSLVWPYEYAILAVWLVLGLVIFVVTRATDDAHALRALLGDDQYRVLYEKRDGAHD